MATGHWFTNRGKLLIAQGQWDDAGASAIKMGLLKAQGAAADTSAEVALLNTVGELLAISAELTVSGYSRQALTRSASSEDDGNNRVNMDAGDVSFGALATGETIYGAFFYDATVDTNDTSRLLLSVDYFATPLPTNGAAFTYTIADLYRLS